MRLTGIAAFAALLAAAPLAPANAATHHPAYITSHATLTRAGHALPHCASDDGSAPQLPCIWIGTKDGNGKGRSFISRRNGHIQFIWANNPVRNHPHRKWISSALSDALAESGLPHAGRNWQHCYIHIADTSTIHCPSGVRFDS